jgi:hypothetical protein
MPCVRGKTATVNNEPRHGKHLIGRNADQLLQATKLLSLSSLEPVAGGMVMDTMSG